jgi:uroporphyrinogen-III synthase
VRRLVILRPEPGASATFEKATKLGLDPVKLPLFEIERLSWSPPPDLSQFDGLLLTSASALREAGEGLGRLKRLPVYAVGPATAAAANEAGFGVVEVGSAGLDQLLRSLDPGLQLLHLAGEDRIDPGQAEQVITAVPVYRARPKGVDPAPIAGSVVLVHSPRAGRRLAEMVADRSTTAVAAISSAAAEACGTGWQQVTVAAEPSDRALLALAARLCEKSSE